jgi:hypothetical protein
MPGNRAGATRGGFGADALPELKPLMFGALVNVDMRGLPCARGGGDAGSILVRVEYPASPRNVGFGSTGTGFRADGAIGTTRVDVCETDGAGRSANEERVLERIDPTECGSRADGNDLSISDIDIGGGGGGDATPGDTTPDIVLPVACGGVIALRRLTLMIRPSAYIRFAGSVQNLSSSRATSPAVA